MSLCNSQKFGQSQEAYFGFFKVSLPSRAPSLLHTLCANFCPPFLSCLHSGKPNLQNSLPFPGSARATHLRLRIKAPRGHQKQSWQKCVATTSESKLNAPTEVCELNINATIMSGRDPPATRRKNLIKPLLLSEHVVIRMASPSPGTDGRFQVSLFGCLRRPAQSGDGDVVGVPKLGDLPQKGGVLPGGKVEIGKIATSRNL